MDYRSIERAASEQGWRIREAKRGVMFYSPDGKTIVTWHRTPSDQRAIRNFLSRMRRAGLRWPE